MSISAIDSGLGAVRSGYDFTKMNNKQLYQAAESLQSEGKISVDQEAAMQYVAQGANEVSVNGSASPGISALSTGGTHDFLSEFQDIYKSMESTSGSVGAGLYQSLVGLMEESQNVDSKGSSNAFSMKA